MNLKCTGLVQAPSNIALIKYMGKKDHLLNIPENISLSLTLNGFCTYTGFQVSPITNTQTELFFEPSPLKEWIKVFENNDPENISKQNLIHPHLNQKETDKANKVLYKILPKVIEVLDHFQFEIDLSQRIVFRTANTFPASAGIASSASSMASLTLALFWGLVKDKNKFKNSFIENQNLKIEMASVSRQASGSSCRSFMGPWVVWDEQGVFDFKTDPLKKIPEFSDILILVNHEKKEVSSSLAHERVKTSPHWSGRFTRATERYEQLVKAFAVQDWQKCASLVFNESSDMHHLFHTSVPSFSYDQPQTKKIIQWYKKILEIEPVPPLFTMDAGPNVHLLVQTKEKEKWLQDIQKEFPEAQLLCDKQGSGASLLSWIN